MSTIKGTKAEARLSVINSKEHHDKWFNRMLGNKSSRDHLTHNSSSKKISVSASKKELDNEKGLG